MDVGVVPSSIQSRALDPLELEVPMILNCLAWVLEMELVFHKGNMCS